MFFNRLHDPTQDFENASLMPAFYNPESLWKPGFMRWLAADFRTPKPPKQQILEELDAIDIYWNADLEMALEWYLRTKPRKVGQ